MASGEVLDKCNVCGSQQIVSVDEDNNICQCHSCGYVFDSPRPTAREISAFYSRPTQYDPWLSAEGTRDALWKRRLKRLSKIRKHGTLLDVGTGIGQFLYHAKPFFTEVFGSEVSSSAIEIAKEKYGLELTEGDVTGLDFGRKVVFDNITLFHVLEHVPDPRETVRKCCSLLSDGGVLVIAVPNDIQSLGRNLKRKVKTFLRAIGVRRFSDPGKLGLPKIVLDGTIGEIHLSHFKPSVLRRLLEDSGFKVLEESLDPYYVANGTKLFLYRCLYGLALSAKFVLRKNVYPTMWVVGEKVDRTSSAGQLCGRDSQGKEQQTAS